MSGFMTKSMLGALGATAALLVGLSGPALAVPPASNPGQPFDEILAALGP